MLIEIQFYGIVRTDGKILLGFKRKDTGKVAIVIVTNHYDASALSDALRVRRDTIPNIYDTWADSMRKLGVTVDGLVASRIIDDQIECGCIYAATLMRSFAVVGRRKMHSYSAPSAMRHRRSCSSARNPPMMSI